MSMDRKTGIIPSKLPSVNIPNEFVHELFFRKVFADIDLSKLCEYEDATGKVSTYGWVLDTSRRFARWLHNNNVKKGDSIAFYSKNFLEYLPCLLGTLKVGATITYVRPEMITNKEYREFVGVPRYVMISEDKLDELLSAGYKDIVVYRPSKPLPAGCVDFEEIMQTEESDGDYEIDGTPENTLAVITYSGGTTGNPKPIQITHRAVVSIVVYDIAANISFGVYIEDPVMLTTMPTNHMSGFSRLFSLIHRTKTIVLEPQPSPSEFLGAIQKHKVNAIMTLPMIMVSLTRLPIYREFDLSSLKAVVLVGGVLLPSMHEELKKDLSLDNVLLRLCMSECAGAVSLPTSRPPGSLGGLCPNTEVIVRDIETNQPITTAGTVGELHIRGPQLFIGYLNSPEKTAEAIDAEGFFKTGDLVRFDEDNNLYYFDRVQEVLRHSSGKLVSATELESIIQYYNPSVREVCVIQSAEGPRAIVVPHTWPENLEAYANEILEKANARISDDWKKLTGGITVRKVQEIPRTVLGKPLKRQMKNF